jgi:Resolvase, N terminal domain
MLFSIQEAALRAANCDVIRAEKRSGTTTQGRDELRTILDFLHAGDVLMVTRIDRLARSIADLQDIVRQVRARGASLKATEQPIDTGTAGGKCFFDMLGVFAEFETNLRKERQLDAATVREMSAQGFGAHSNCQGARHRPGERLQGAGSVIRVALATRPRPPGALGAGRREIGAWRTANGQGKDVVQMLSRKPSRGLPQQSDAQQLFRYMNWTDDCSRSVAVAQLLGQAFSCDEACPWRCGKVTQTTSRSRSMGRTAVRQP